MAHIFDTNESIVTNEATSSRFDFSVDDNTDDFEAVADNDNEVKNGTFHSDSNSNNSNISSSINNESIVEQVALSTNGKNDDLDADSDSEHVSFFEEIEALLKHKSEGNEKKILAKIISKLKFDMNSRFVAVKQSASKFLVETFGDLLKDTVYKIPSKKTWL